VPCSDQLQRHGTARFPAALRHLFVLAALLAAASCSDVKVASEQKPAARVDAIVVDRVLADKPEWERIAHRIRRQLVAELKDRPAFDVVGTAEPALVPPGLVHVDGRIEALDPGVDFVSMLTGAAGWGGASLRVGFRIRDRDGRVLADFTEAVTASEPLAETTVIGDMMGAQFDPLYADDLADALADRVASAIAGWAAGRGLN
jgi:hypothetical protein